MDAAAIIEALAPFPRGGIAQLPTPLEPAPGLAAELGLSALAVKRDDRTSPRYGGNKVRKLDFLLGQALAEGRRAVVTFGAYGSNHALATALHARALGLEPHRVRLEPE
ncbi:MAG: pyridoxal-phosphate dependent enzyme, partial [Anaerosomatales bacterium]|nr:pyridoxal-phosphate dependent enzyme [Anaerosomatales bacterium]